MEEHEDEVMLSVDKSTVTIDSSEWVLTEGNQGEDVIVDIVGSDAVEDNDHGRVEVNLNTNTSSEELVDGCMQEELKNHDDDMVGFSVLTSEKDEVVVYEEEVAGSGEVYSDPVEFRVLTSEKVEVIMNEEEFDINTEVREDVLQGDDVITVAKGSNGDIVEIGNQELTERGFNVEELTDRKITESLILTTDLGSQEGHMVFEEGFAEDTVSVDPSSVSANNQSSAAELVSSPTYEIDESSKDYLQPTIKVIPDDDQEMTVVDRVVNVIENEELVSSIVSEPLTTTHPVSEIDESSKGYLQPTIEVIPDDDQEMTVVDHVVNVIENEVLVSSIISEPLTTTHPVSEDVDMALVVEDEDLVDQSLVCSDDRILSTEAVNAVTCEDEINVHAESLVQQDEDDKLSEKESAGATPEVITETDVIFENEADGGLTKDQEIMEQPTEPDQNLDYVNGVMDEKTGEENEFIDPSKIPESLTIVDPGPEEVSGVKSPVFLCEDADMDRGEDAGMDIDEVLDQKDEVPGIDVASGAEKDQNFNAAANSEANVEQKLLGSSSGPILIQHREEYTKSREPIVYGRRAHVEVPVYESLDVEQKLPGSSSPVSEDEHLKIETDSEEDDDDDDDESLQEDEQKVDRQNPELLENEILISLDQSSYFKPPSNEGEFSVSDLVWGKVRSHPWWPGQIIDPSNASKKAMKYYKKDCFLVAYFGDHSFAWNSPSVLKPFWANFSQFEKQADTEIFQIAVDCALEEVSRRVELGLSCSCVPKEIFKEIQYQVVENAGVGKKSNKIHEKDESASVSSFEPDKLVDYVRLLAQFPDQVDKMDLAITKAQLSSYGHYKGYRELTEFCFCGDLLDDDSVHEKVEQVHRNGEQFENDLIETVKANKEISLSEVTDDAPESASRTSKLVSVSSSGVKKRKARVTISNGSVKRPNRPSNKVTAAPISTPKPSFKVGALIQRVASQLTGPPLLKSGSDPMADHGQHATDQIARTPENPQTDVSAAQMLSQLHLTAQDPMKEYGFFQTIIPFFYERRAAVFSKSVKKASTIETPESDKKPNLPNENDPEEFDFDFDFDFDDVKDSYWTDRIVQNHSEDQLLQDTQNGGMDEHQVIEYEPDKVDKPVKRRRRSNKKQKQVLSCNHEPEPEPEEESEIDRKRRENSATEVIIKFEEGINFRSEIQLNKMFRRFGSLMESETEVDRLGGRARVVFKRCFDAEVAHSSAGKFNIFGSISVNYELNYNPLVSYKPLPPPLLQEDLMDAT